MQSLLKTTRCALGVNLRRGSTEAHATSRHKRVYELRTYDIKPEFYPAFLSLTKEKIGMRFEASPALGYWTAEIGGLNQVVHIWEYESLEARLKVRAQLAGHEKWNKEYMDVMRPMLAKQSNLLMVATRELQKPPQTKPGTYELRIFESLPRLSVDWSESFAKIRIEYLFRFHHHFISHLVSLAKGVTLVGSWRTTIGDAYRDVHLWHYEHIDQIHENPAKEPPSKYLTNITGVETKLLAPTSFSALI